MGRQYSHHSSGLYLSSRVIVKTARRKQDRSAQRGSALKCEDIESDLCEEPSASELAWVRACVRVCTWAFKINGHPLIQDGLINHYLLITCQETGALWRPPNYSSSQPNGMNRDRNAKANQGAGALQKYHRECALAWMDEVGGSGMVDAQLWLGLGCASGGGGSVCVVAPCGWGRLDSTVHWSEKSSVWDISHTIPVC